MQYLLVFVFLLSTFGVVHYNSQPEDATTLPRFVATQSKGNVRVTLVEVSQRTMFTSEWWQPASEQRTNMPCSYVEVVVEYLDENDHPIQSTGYSGVKFFRDGELIKTQRGCVSGGVSGVYPYTSHSDCEFAMPEVTDPERTYILKSLQRGIDLPERVVDMNIRLGFDDVIEEFVFKDVPLN